MNRLIRSLSPLALSIAALTAVAPLAATGCSENKQTIAIIGALPPPKRQDASESCQYSGQEATSVLSSGAVDLSVASSYTIPLLVENFLQKSADPAIRRAESRDITLDSMEVTIYDGNAPILPTFNTSFTSGFVPAGERSVIFATLIPTGAINALLTQNAAGKQLRALIRASGTTSGNVDVETPEFQYLIDVGKGNLVTGRTATGTCPEATPDVLKTYSIPCQAGVDQPLNCALCAQGVIACPGYK